MSKGSCRSVVRRLHEKPPTRQVPKSIVDKMTAASSREMEEKKLTQTKRRERIQGHVKSPDSFRQWWSSSEIDRQYNVFQNQTVETNVCNSPRKYAMLFQSNHADRFQSQSTPYADATRIGPGTYKTRPQAFVIKRHHVPSRSFANTKTRFDQNESGPSGYNQSHAELQPKGVYNSTSERFTSHKFPGLLRSTSLIYQFTLLRTV